MIEKLKKHYYLTFTLMFIVVAIIAFSPFWLNGKSFILMSITKDGLEQHYNALMYLGKWGREILKNLFINHTIQIPMWDFSLGYGADIISTLHYYAIGDPLNLLSILVPSEYTENLYNFLVVLRVYFAGLSFSAYCFYMKQKKEPVLIGTFIYMFCGYALFAFARHPFFINPMIYLPLLLIAAEKVMKTKRMIMLIGIVFLMTLSSFYFSYILLLLLVVYVAIRFFCVHHTSVVKEGLEYLLRFGTGILLGLMMAGVIFLPTVIQFFSGERVSGNAVYDALYELKYYERVIATYISAGDAGQWTCLGFAPIGILAVILLFLKNKHRELKVGFIVLTIFCIIPFFGVLFNGMSYIVNRWIFSYAFLVAFILVAMWDDLMNLTIREKQKLIVVSMLYFLLILLLDYGTGENTMASMIILFLMIIVLLQGGDKKRNIRRNTILFLEILALTILSIGVNVKYEFGTQEGDYISQFLDSGTARDTLYQTGDYAIRKADKDFDTIERIDQPDGLANSSWQNGTYGLSYYASLENGVISKFMQEMGLSQYYASWYHNLDSRTMLNALASVRYYVNENIKEGLPYGYNKSESVTILKDRKYQEYQIVENEYALPLGYTYESYSTREEYDEMSPIQRQQALMQSILLEKPLNSYKHENIDYTDEKITYDIECSSDVWTDGEEYIALKDGTEITLNFEGKAGCETYIYIDGMDITGLSEKDLYFDRRLDNYIEKWDDLSKIEKRNLNYFEKYYKEPTQYDIKFKTNYGSETLRYLTEESKYNMGQTEYLVNLGYHNERMNEVTIVLPKRGIYNLSNLEVYCQPMAGYREQIQELRKDVLENETIGINKVSGTITLDQDKILCLSIPYGKGWRAYVDGEEVEVLQGNTMSMALILEAGIHNIELRYMTPGIKLGVAFSIVGCVCYIFLCLYQRKRYKN